MRRIVDDVVDAIIAGDGDLDGFWQWETSEPLRPILRAAISGEPERIASAILPNDDLIPALPDDCAVEVSAVAGAGGVIGDRTDDLPLAFAATLRHEVADPTTRGRRGDARFTRRRASGAADRSGRRVVARRGGESSPTSRPRTATSGPRSADAVDQVGLTMFDALELRLTPRAVFATTVNV